MSITPIRYGILSTSSIAPRFLAGVRDAEAGEAVALSSRSLEKAREKAALWDIPKAYGDHRQLLEDPEVDVVYISTVNALHAHWAREALLHGKHVICEKPCTASAEETRQLFQLARERGLFFMEAVKMLFLPAVVEIRRRIRRGDFGAIRMAELRHSFPGTYNDWMYDPQAGGGPLLSSGIYVMELLLWLFGPIRQLSGVRTTWHTGVECQYVLSGAMENGVLFSAQNSTLAPLQDGARFYGENGWIDLPLYWTARQVTFHVNGAPPETLEFPCEHEIIYEARHIRDCLERGALTSPVVTPDLSIAAAEALDCLRAQWSTEV